MIIDSCTLSLSKSPSGGFVLRMSDIDASMLAGITVAVDVAEEAAKALIAEATKITGGVVPADLSQMKRAVKDVPQA